MVQQADALMNIHGRPIFIALLAGLASVTPRSALPNLIDLISLLALKRSDQIREWTKEILFSVGSLVDLSIQLVFMPTGLFFADSSLG